MGGAMGRRQFLKMMEGAFIALAGVAVPRGSAAAEAVAPRTRSRVVSLFHPQATIGGSGRDNCHLRAEVVARMVDHGVRAFTRKKSRQEAWRTIIPDPNKKVAIKINCQIEGIYTKSTVVHPIVDGLLSAGMSPENIFIYDMRDTAFALAGFEKNLGPGVKVGTVADFGGYARFLFDRMANLLTGGYPNSGLNLVARLKRESAWAPVRGLCSLVLAGWDRPYDCDYLINVPVLKALDGYSGVSLSMKNHFGSIGNPGEHHHELMDFLPQLNARPEIRSKTRLIVLDAIFGEYKWVNGRDQTYVDIFNKLLIADDPVAVDSLGWQMIEAKRREKGLPPVSPQPAFIRKAAAAGLGVDDPERIELVDILMKS